MFVLFIKVYEVTGVVSSILYKGYAKLDSAHKLEWNNRWLFLRLCYTFLVFTTDLQCLIMVALLSRGISTFHALFVAVASVYILIVSDLFKEGSKNDLITYRRSILSDTALGVRSWILLCNLWLFCYCIRLMLVHLNVLIYQMNNVFFWRVNYKLKPYALQTLHKQKILSIQRKVNI